MKKIVTVLLAMMMVLSLGISVFAEPGGFVSSPSRNQAPELIKAENESEDCEAKLIITAYSDRDELSEEARKNIEDAYSDIVGTQDLSSLNDAIKNIAKKLGLNTTDLAVSDMFDISATECNGHEDHGHFDITLKAETLDNFVCLLHYYNGEWRVVDNAKVTNNGEHLEFDEDEFSPFAIVVSTVEISDGVGTIMSGGSIIAIVAFALATAGAIVAAVVIKRKKKA